MWSEGIWRQDRNGSAMLRSVEWGGKGSISACSSPQVALGSATLVVASNRLQFCVSLKVPVSIQSRSATTPLQVCANTHPYCGIPTLTPFALNGVLAPSLCTLGGGSSVGALFGGRMS